MDHNPWLGSLPELTALDGPAAVRVEPDGTISVRAGRLGLTTASLVSALRAADVDHEIMTVPASPFRVGKVRWLTDGPTLTVEAIPDLEGQSFRILPDRLAGPLVLQAGVEAGRGESYGLTASAFAPGEVLGSAHCAGDDPMSSATLARYARTAGVQVEWAVLARSRLPDGTVEADYQVPATRRPDGLVEHVESLDRERVLATIAPWHLRALTVDAAGRTVEGKKARGATPQGEGGRNIPCDPAEVARWR